MATLHTVNKSPFQTQTLLSCLSHVQAGDSVLMIEDGVYGAMGSTTLADAVAGLGGQVNLFVLGEDLAARGIDAGRIADGITKIDMDGFVDMVASTDRTQSWL